MVFSRWVWISSTLFWDGGDFKTAGDRKKWPRPVTLSGSGARQQIDFAAKASERHAKPPRRVLESQIAAPVNTSAALMGAPERDLRRYAMRWVILCLALERPPSLFSRCPRTHLWIFPIMPLSRLSARST